MKEVESVEALEKKLQYARCVKRIEDEMSSMRCPVCGGRLTYEINPAYGLDGRGGGEIRCVSCGIGKSITMDSTDSYNWVHDGESYSGLLSRLWDGFKGLCRPVDPDEVEYRAYHCASELECDMHRHRGWVVPTDESYIGDYIVTGCDDYGCDVIAHHPTPACAVCDDGSGMMAHMSMEYLSIHFKWKDDGSPCGVKI